MSSSTDDQSVVNARSERSNTRSEAQKNRVSTACTYCRYRKVKCDGGKPSCSFCVHTSRCECVYAKVSEEENQYLRTRKRELRARRAAELLRIEQGKRANLQSASSSKLILTTLDLPSSSSLQSAPRRRISSISKRSRARLMARSSGTSQSNPNIFSSSALSQHHQESFPSKVSLTDLPAELTNTFSSNFLNMVTPQSHTNFATVESSLNPGIDPYPFPPTSMPINDNTFDVNTLNLGEDYGNLSLSASAAISSSSFPLMLMNKRQKEDNFHRYDRAQNDQNHMGRLYNPFLHSRHQIVIL